MFTARYAFSLLLVCLCGCRHVAPCAGGVYRGPPRVECERAEHTDSVQRPPLARIMPEVLIDYPYAMWMAGVGGFVEVRVSVDADGHVVDVRLERASHTEFSDSVYAAFSHVSYFPARGPTGAVPCTIQYRFRFVPDAESSGSAEPRPAASAAITEVVLPRRDVTHG
jgi:TonB family protein